jgi:acetylornithine deacetylase/succinyl-diaminopimelate desuccinylase-like protein
MVDFTRELIAIPTENPPGNCYGEAQRAILDRLRQLGFDDTRTVGECILSFLGEAGPTVYFSGHYDVVPAQDRAQFETSIQGANLFGRGSSDMKAGLAAMTYAAVALREHGLPRGGRIGLLFVPDEETAGPRGSRRLEAEGLLGENAIAMLTPEPTGGVIWNANRGAITLRVTVPGKTAHVGRQTEGVNAFERMLAIAQAVMNLKSEVETRSTSYRIAPDGLRRSILMLGGECASGSGFNVVPASCWFTIDRRLNPEEDFEVEKRRLFEVLGGTAVEILQEGAAAATAEDSRAARVLAGAIRRVTGREPEFELCPGLLETRFYASRGIPAFAYGPGLLTVSHGPNEFVSIDRMVECAAIYAATAAELLYGLPHDGTFLFS